MPQKKTKLPYLSHLKANNIYSKKIRVFDFEQLESVQHSLGNVSVRTAEIITPDQIGSMLQKTLLKLAEKNRAL